MISMPKPPTHAPLRALFVEAVGGIGARPRHFNSSGSEKQKNGSISFIESHISSQTPPIDKIPTQ